MLSKSHYNPEIFQTALRSAAESYHVISSVRSVPRNLKPSSWSPELCCFWIQDEKYISVCVISLQLDFTYFHCVTRKEKTFYFTTWAPTALNQCISMTFQAFLMYLHWILHSSNRHACSIAILNHKRRNFHVFSRTLFFLGFPWLEDREMQIVSRNTSFCMN